MSVIFLIVGLILLVKGADYFVDGSSSIAKRLNIPSIVIGLTLVAFGTSAPELAVSISGSINEANGIVFGNVVGSNIVNILFILGLSAFITPINIKTKTIFKEMPFAILTTIAMMLMVMDGLINGDPVSTISRSEGWILLLFFAIYLYSMVEITISDNEESQEQIPIMPIAKSIFFTISGLIAIIWGADLVVKGAIEIATIMGLSETVIGLTIVAIGTSLPELITSVMAAKKGENDIAVGNIVGSCIFNVLLVLGISGVIYPINISPENYSDLWILLVSMLIVVPMMYTSKKISRCEGILMIFGYVGYTAFIIARTALS
ncbi:calcium/sodium antiporter [Acetobacterium woodii]|uniref:K+-dependent Na+/Ca+ exchanger-like-protein n=1 Tax=Acetobacterium woodii (strain ATCC 29683 / DSM 1030 / JCM 2381 / KCTC 1655 / WB1) TaxID=931626 RepID=H6LKL1_ACEWD|nr:calcium/sodium antiporter [Acetobacterium woodii]AFA48803.1 K+-dependent Na+/Ca+ exchanger-like-protein [Acetobacterium woodii DSM 1030]